MRRYNIAWLPFLLCFLFVLLSCQPTTEVAEENARGPNRGCRRGNHRCPARQPHAKANVNRYRGAGGNPGGYIRAISNLTAVSNANRDRDANALADPAAGGSAGQNAGAVRDQ